MYSEQTIHRLDSLSLADVMEMNGYPVSYKTGNRLFYHCPLPGHTDRTPSFYVYLRPQEGYRYCGWKCMGCGRSGQGAISLQQVLLGELPEGEQGYKEAVKRLLKDFNLEVEGEYKNSIYDRSTPIEETVTEFSYVEKEGPLTHAELRALGCKVEQVYRLSARDGQQVKEATLSGGQACYHYSWGKTGADEYNEGNAFDSSVLKEQFGLVAIESCVFMQTDTEGKVKRCFRERSTDTFPIFLLRYVDEKGWWIKKYEPLYRQTFGKDGKPNPNHKFTWWYEGNRKRYDLGGNLYGNKDVMDALRGGQVITSDPERHPVVTVLRREAGEKKNVTVFKSVVICSGPRDALSVYFHSDAQVVYPHSENVEISDEWLRRLHEVAESVYVLFDADKTGVREMNRLCFRDIDLIPIYLPEDLCRVNSPRTGKPCKDAEEFFNNYHKIMRTKTYMERMSVNGIFREMVRSAIPMRFWEADIRRKKDEEGNSYNTVKFSLSYYNLRQFLVANGLYRYCLDDNQQDYKYVLVTDQKFRFIEEKDVMMTVRNIIAPFVSRYSGLTDEEKQQLPNMISTQTKINRSTFEDLPVIRLNLKSFGPDFEYFFFQNCAVRVTRSGIETVNYKDLPFHVNELAIQPYTYTPVYDPLFKITETQEYLTRKAEFENNINCKYSTPEEMENATMEFTNYELMNRFHLELTEGLEFRRMLPALQYLYDTGRIYWRKEKLGIGLTEEERQFQDMQFVNKVCAIGYLLSRERRGSMQNMVFSTDYSVANEDKASGGSGKSTLEELLKLVRQVYSIKGKDFKRKENTSKNFDRFVYTVHNLIFLDDLSSDISDEELYNMTTSISVKWLYKNEFLIPSEFTPKVIFNANKIKRFDLSNASTRRRLILTLFSDYFHAAQPGGREREHKVYHEFGKEMIKEATPEELNQTIHLLLRCCQFFFQVNDAVQPPVERDGLNRMLYSSIKDSQFIQWAAGYFSRPIHFHRPIAIQEIIMDYLDYRGEEITGVSIRRIRREFMENLNTYCLSMQYILNPRVVYRAQNMERSLYPRWTTWATEFEHDRPNGRPRVRRSMECCFFYKINDEIPADHHDVLKCPDTDIEMSKEDSDGEETNGND